jgi:DNA mismatch repair ATPase MutS
VHVTEGVEQHGEGVRLVFDYRLQPGIATSRNALKLLRSVGLDE